MLIVNDEAASFKLSERTSNDFDISMNDKLCGVSARLLSPFSLAIW
jgi:hypothetical protein